MGFYADYDTFADAKRAVLTPEVGSMTRILGTAVRGRGQYVWVLMEDMENGLRWIGVNVIRSTNTTPKRYGTDLWIEPEGLSYFDCPIEFLDATSGRNKYYDIHDAIRWHERVRKLARDKEDRKRERELAVPDRFKRIARLVRA